MSTVWGLQHAPCETLGIIATVLESEGLSPQYVRTFEGQPVPPGMEQAAGLIVMGGPMSVYEAHRYPFLREEMRLIEQAIHAEKPVLGVCLGSQLLAATLGAAVIPGEQKEIGWHPITLTDSALTDRLWVGLPHSFLAYHWHGDVFPLPEGAVSLASSLLTPCQAFRYGHNAYGFLFHLEVTPQIIEEMVNTFSEELREARIDGREIVEQASHSLPSLHNVGRLVFQRWAGLVL